MIWKDHSSIGISESGYYTCRRITHGWSVWRRLRDEFERVGEAPTLPLAKQIAQADHDRVNA